MGAAAYNRGTRQIAREADEAMPAAALMADRRAYKDEIARLREQVRGLERDLQRARRCLAAERLGRESLRSRLATEERSNSFAAGCLCKIAFPGDQ